MNTITNPKYSWSSLNDGIDYRIIRGSTNELQALQLNICCDNINGTERMSDRMLSGSESYTFPSSAQTAYIASTSTSDISLNAQVIYYEDISSNSYRTEDIDMNGRTPIQIPNTVYRIVKIIMLSSGFAGDLWIGQSFTNGVPSTKYAGCDHNLMESKLPYVYCPNGKKLLCLGYFINNNSTSGDNMRIYQRQMRDYQNPTSLTETFRMDFTGSNNNFSLSTPCLEIIEGNEGGITSIISSQRTSGLLSTLSVNILGHYLLITPN